MAFNNLPSPTAGTNTSKFVNPEGKAYTADLAQNASCLFVYLEDLNAPFQFVLQKHPAGTNPPARLGDMVVAQRFMAQNAGTLLVFQDGTADWNF